ncbi:MAG: hybrid sensor histidine kinase/response regulator transcription factor [Luteimonas sp.]
MARAREIAGVARKLIYALTILIAAHASAVWATDRFVVRHYGSTDGLPVSSAASSRVDEKGFLWLATHDGLVRFDGEEFRTFNVTNVPEMRSNRIVDLYGGEKGFLYALTINGELLRLTVGGPVRVRFGGNSSNSIVRAVHDGPFCVTTARGLFCENDDGGFSMRLGFEAGLDVAAAFPADEHHAWLIVPGKGILLQAGRQRRLLFDNAELASAPGIPPKAVVGPAGELTVALKDGVLQVARNGRSRWLLRSSDRPIEVIQLRHDRDGTLWIGSGEALFSADRADPSLARGSTGAHGTRVLMRWSAPDGARWESDGGLLFREGVQVLDSSGQIRDVHFDAMGTTWISTLRDGIYALSRPRVDVIGLADGLRSDNVYTVANDGTGVMWLGSLNGPLQAVDAGGDVRSYGIESGLPGMNPWVVEVAPDNAVYVGTYAPGLFRKDANSDRFENVALPPLLAQARTLALSFDRAGRLWQGTTSGVWRYDGGVWRKVWPKDKDIRTQAILHAADGDVWYGTDDGLWRQRDGAVEAVAADLLKGVTVRGLLQDRGGAVWASTEGYGLVRIAASPSGRMQVVRLGRAEGLPSDSPHSVLEDADGNLWVNSNQGIFRITAKGLESWMSGSTPTLTPLSLGLADGLPDLEGNGGLQPAAAFDNRGRIWFPFQRGVVRIDPRRFPMQRPAPLAVINGIETGDSKFPGDRFPRLPAGLRSLSIHYSASDLYSGNAVRFRYRLFPGDGRWVDVRSQRTVSLASLLPGDYRFELIAANSDGVWSPRPTRLEFTIPARWYETAFSRWLVLIFLAASMFLVAQYRVRAARARAEELDQQVQGRTKELDLEKRQVEAALAKLSESHRVIEGKNLRLADQASRLEKVNEFRARLIADVSHELRTPLMLASMPLKEIDAKTPDLTPGDHERLRLSISQMDRLTLLVQQLLSLAQAEAGQIKLRITSFDICRLVNSIADGFGAANERSRIRFEVRSDIPSLPVFADSDRLTTVLHNLLENAARYAPDDSVVGVHLSVDGAAEMARIVVSDTGPGFAPSLAERLFQRFFRGEPTPQADRGGLGIGLAVARELMELHGGKIGAVSKPGDGAHFWITLPLGSAHVSFDELLTESTRPEALPVVPKSKPSGATKLLIVEDHPELANYLRDRLSEYCPVQVAADSDEALQWLERERFGMALVDVVLPGMDGIALCRKIKVDPGRSYLPVLLMSARADSAGSQAGLGAGATEYLVKPFGFETLLAAIARAWPDASLYFKGGGRLVPNENADPLLVPALNALSDSDFDVGQWAKRAYLSERQLRRKVIELTGLSPVAWLREQRLLRVRKLISDGACRTLSEAGAKVGLDNPSYLYRIYRARFGMAEE